MRSPLLSLSVFPLALAAACGSSSSSQQQTSMTDAGDGGSVVLGADGSTRETGADGQTDGLDAADASAAPSTIYVSTVGGNDSNSGLSPSEPKKTIAAGILAAATGGLEVHVCKGAYPESALNLTETVTLRGAYDCGDWTRTATYGYPKFDQSKETIIQNGDLAAQAATLLVSEGVPSSVTIDGFTVQGATTGSTPTVGISVQGTASPKISNCSITGGGGTQGDTSGSAQPASVGILVGGSASPELTLDTVSGGTGTGTATGYGSTGVLLGGTGVPSLHDAVVTGGVPAAGNAAGIQSTTTLTRANDNPLQNLKVMGVDDGRTVAATCVGVLVAGSASVDLVDSDVYADDAPGVTPAPTLEVGVEYRTTGVAFLSGDRIYGGSTTTSPTIGVAVVASVFEMDNSMVHGGEGAELNPGATGGVSADAATTLNFDTIYAGAKASTAVIGGYGANAVTMKDVLLLGGSSAYALLANACKGNSGGTNPPPSFALVSNTVLGGFEWADYCVDAAPCGPALSDLTSNDLGNLGTSTPNDTLLTAAQCGTVCSMTLFGSTWSTDDGLTALFSSTVTDAGTSKKGWTFAEAPPCVIATGGAAVTGVTADINGTARSSSTPSVGATEVSGGACTP